MEKNGIEKQEGNCEKSYKNGIGEKVQKWDRGPTGSSGKGYKQFRVRERERGRQMRLS